MTAGPSVNVRVWHGYHQLRDGADSPWRFLVTGFGPEFSGQKGTCTVLLANGTEEKVTIDENDCLRIRGQSFDRRHWSH